MRSTLRALFVALTTLAVLVPTAVNATHLPEDNYVQETLVEGHTVFTVLAVSDYLPSAATVAASPEPPAAPADDGSDPGHPSSPSARVHRDPGVLWYNDQFLVEPTLSVEPLGGEGSPVVRNHFAAAVAVLVKRTASDGRSYTPCGGAVLLTNAGDPDPRVSDPLAAPTMLGGALSPVQYGYLESYLLTDPNDATWVVDRYAYYTQLSPETLRPEAARPFEVLVANVGGGPLFRPDAGASCDPVVDRPAALQPSRNGYCYNGAPMAAPPCASIDGAQPAPHEPARQYNALLFAPLEALRVEGAPRLHDSLADPAETNGCDSRSAAWPCPGGDDDAEGFSHPFRPLRPTVTMGLECPQGLAAFVPTDHGGSSSPYPACGPDHATRLVDVWFDASGRPPEPPLRDFVILETSGSAAAFSGYEP